MTTEDRVTLVTVADLISSKYKVVTSTNIDMLCHSLNQEPEHVWVRDLRKLRVVVPFAIYAHGPFCRHAEDGHMILTGFDKEGSPAKLRVVNLRTTPGLLPVRNRNYMHDAICAYNVVEISTSATIGWITPAHGNLRIYMPNKEL